MHTKYFIESTKLHLQLAKDVNFQHQFAQAVEKLIACIRRGNTIFIGGNGGSAADAQHFAAELSGGNFLGLRKNFSAIALTANSSVVTAIANDFGYDQLFVRQLEALGKPGDFFCGISTSGNSPNIVIALAGAKKLGMMTMGLLGSGGGNALPLCDYPIVVPSDNTQHIQEAHIVIIHALCVSIYEKDDA